MAITSDPLDNACAVCGKAASTHCTGCFDQETAHSTTTFYCSKDCQTQHWPSHKTACRAGSAKRLLFRAGQLLQDVFFATRPEVFDISIAQVTYSDNGVFFRDGPDLDIVAGPIKLPNSSDAKRALPYLLSYSSGGEAFAGPLYLLGLKAFKGCAAKFEKLDIRVSQKHLFVSRSHKTSTTPEFHSLHHIVRATLKDGSVWAIDIAGAQHRQNMAVLPFTEYENNYIEEVLACRPFVARTETGMEPLLERNRSASGPGYGPEYQISIQAARDIYQVLDNLNYQENELENWVLHNSTVETLLATTNAAVYRKQRDALLSTLATAARECAKLAMADPSSKAKVFLNPNHKRTEENLARDRREKDRADAKTLQELRDFLMKLGL
ncbi:hypothetical protein Q7P37_000997 [Cladosporium fusiforme]